jgi:hypothetical protein
MPMPMNITKAATAWRRLVTRRSDAGKRFANPGCHMVIPVRKRTAMMGTIDQYMSFWPALYLAVSWNSTRFSM